MEGLLKNEVVRGKIKSLSAPVRRAFIESLLDLYEQETEEMIDVIEESRLTLREDFMSYKDDSTSLRSTSRMLEEKRKEHDKECVDDYVQRKLTSSKSDSRLSYVDEKSNSTAVSDYLKKRGKKKPPLAETIIRSHSTDGRQGNRADSVMSTRSLPTPVVKKTVEEEKDEVMKNLSDANRQNEVERLRQKELIEKRREQRRQQKQSTEEKALELLEKALAMDKRIQEKKKEQDSKLKERLEDMKRKRAESRVGNYGPETGRSSSKDRSNETRDKSEKDSSRKSEVKPKKKDTPKSEDATASGQNADYDFEIY